MVHIPVCCDSRVSMSYGDDFFDSIEDGSLASARVIVPIVRELIPFHSVLDVGCGRGVWLSVFKEYGAENIVGYDGDYVDRARLLIPCDCFRPANLDHTLSISEQFDLAVCLEVGEHLPAAASSALVSTLTNAAPAVLFSAAMPGQGGTNHINEQWPSYWERLFAAHEFVRLDPIRPAIWRNAAVKWWYKQNVFLFVNSSELGDNIPLAGEYGLAQSNRLQLVHEDILNYHVSVRGTLRALKAASWRALLHRLGLR